MKRTHLTTLAAAFGTLALTLALAACAPQQGPAGEGADSDGDIALAATGSLAALHPDGQLDGIEEVTNKLCLSCHPRATIEKANEGYGGHPDFNPHKAHLAAGDCTSCHSLEGTSVMSCNECHNAPLPDGWESAPRGSGPLHALF